MSDSVTALIQSKKDWTKDDFVFFWGHHKTKGINKGCFSQWWPCSFAVDNITYNCAEQYMMAGKARLFNDTYTLQKILESKDPATCKYLGRQVKDFNPEIWEEHCSQIVFEGNYAKFSQNKDLKKELLSTGNKILVEASPYDRIWGIGMTVDNPDCSNPSKWKGTNLLGFILTDVRTALKNSDLYIITE